MSKSSTESPPPTDITPLIEERKESDEFRWMCIAHAIEEMPQHEQAPPVLLAAAGVMESAARLGFGYHKLFAQKVCEHFDVYDKFSEHLFTKQLAEIKKEQKSSSGGKNAVPSARESDYYALFRSVFGEVRRDIFSKQLMIKNDGLWEPLIERGNVSRLKAHAHNQEQRGTMRYSKSAIEDYIFELEARTDAELLCEIPAWDGQDRLVEIASNVKLTGAGGLTSDDFYQLLGDWFSKAFQRLKDPYVQNRILILKGGQGLGKDTLVNTLTGALGQWVTKLNIIHENKDSLMQLHTGLVMNISEFDRSAKMSVAFLKQMITDDCTDIRFPYDRTFRKRMLRCSFISTCNVNDILRDHTGNRRYMIFDIDRINWSYPRTDEDKRQILAQAQHLADQGFTAAEHSNKLMRVYIDGLTPDDPAELIAEDWFEGCRKLLDGELKNYDGDRYFTEFEAQEIRANNFLPSDYANPVFEYVNRFHRLNKKQLTQKLSEAGIKTRRRVGDQRPRGFLISYQKSENENPGQEF